MTKSLVTLVRSLKKSDDQAQRDINDIAKAMRGKTPEKVRAALMPAVGKVYSVKLVAGQGKATGQKVLDSEATNYEAARKMLQRILNALSGDTPTQPATKHTRWSRDMRNLAKDFLSHFEGKDTAEKVRKAKALLNAL